jgi:hypothetical protein
MLSVTSRSMSDLRLLTYTSTGVFYMVLWGVCQALLAAASASSSNVIIPSARTVAQG